MEANSYKILVVEDEEAISDVLSERLKNEGFAVVVASDGEQGLAMAESEKPDLILLDILMPKKGGLSMLQELRASEYGKNIPVMMLTNLSDTEDVNKALEAGAFGYMVKADWKIAEVVASIWTQLEPRS